VDQNGRNAQAVWAFLVTLEWAIVGTPAGAIIQAKLLQLVTRITSQACLDVSAELIGEGADEIGGAMGNAAEEAAQLEIGNGREIASGGLIGQAEVGGAAGGLILAALRISTGELLIQAGIACAILAMDN
jgi:hypothetical protein